MISFLKELLMPSFCWYCRGPKQNESLCVSCTKLIVPILSTKVHNFAVHALSSYDEPLKSMIRAKNYSAYDISCLLAQIIWHHSVLKNISADYLVPVPLHKTRELFRGYNQALVIARELSKLSGIPVNDCIVRKKRTKYQAESLLTNERYANVEGAFELTASAELCFGKEVVIIDDLMTSGATLYAVGKEVLKSKPKKVHAVVACRGVVVER